MKSSHLLLAVARLEDPALTPRFAALFLLLPIITPSPVRAEKSITERAKSHWAFRPIHRAVVPSVRDRSWVRTPIDSFLLTRLEASGLKPAAPAQRHTLLRRVTLDLTGLPPTPDERQAFLDDPSPLAYARLVDRLLASPAYGERWGRHWLDVARYADTNGYERDGDKPSAWRYRDYVIDAANRDLPFDRFVMEQIAGDELPGSDARTRIATTFLRLGTWDDEPADARTDRYDQLDDVLGTTATAFLAQTIRCARCHDHKFEPFSQREYYRLLAVFEPLRRPQKGRADLDRVVGGETEPLVFFKTIAFTPKPPTRAYIWFEDGPKAPVTHIFRRGNPEFVGKAVEPGVPAVIAPVSPSPPNPLERSTGRRLWLARWLASAENPLTARVIVNRVWQWHFGRGIVGTAGDFGLMGEPPTHPELLDWLASEFMRGGWSLKQLHRLIVLSSAYQTSSTDADGNASRKVDLFGRWRQRRLEAEAVRDGMLAVSGKLHRQAGGPGVYPVLPPEVLASQSRPGLGWGKSDERQSSRRSVYVFAKRSLALPELELLDSPDTTASCEQRNQSTTAPQALTLLNGSFMREQANHFADRLLREAGLDDRKQIERAFVLALARPPSTEEREKVLAFLHRQARQIVDENPTHRAVAKRLALASFCLVLFNTNEFIYPS